MKTTTLRLLWASALALSPSFAGAAERETDAERIAHEFSFNWQNIEVVVFERLGVRETPGEEDRVPEQGDRILPASFWSITDATDNAPGFGVDATTRSAVDSFQLGTAVGMPGFENAVRVVELSPEEVSAEPGANSAAETGEEAVADPPPPPTPEEIFRTAVAAFEKDLARAALTAHATQDHKLQGAANQLVAQAGARILWHRRWTQPFGRGAAALPVYIQAGYPVLGLRTLEGTLSIRGTQSFSTTARLWLHGPFQGQVPTVLPVRASDRWAASGELTDPFASRHILSETRNIKSDEVHYFDHPYFGVLISIAPVGVPDSLLADWQTMQSAASAPASETGIQQ
jgi:hypothetical protein